MPFSDIFVLLTGLGYFSENPFSSIHVYLYFKEYLKKKKALTKDVPENIQR